MINGRGASVTGSSLISSTHTHSLAVLEHYLRGATLIPTLHSITHIHTRRFAALVTEKETEKHTHIHTGSNLEEDKRKSRKGKAEIYPQTINNIKHTQTLDLKTTIPRINL